MIRYENVSVKHGGVDVLKDFNLRVDEGDKVLIYGKSGIGKSTILKLLLGFTYPDSGTLYFRDRELDKRTIWEVRKQIAYVSQDLDICEGKVNDFVCDLLGYKTNSEIQDRERKTRQILELMELDTGILDKDFEDLSGGEKQRISLMAALLLERGIFLLDEVTSSVDTRLKKKIVDHFTSLEGATVLAVSHDINWLDEDRLRVVRLGRA